MKRIIVFFLLILSLHTKAQDSQYARIIVDTLTSKVFWGRGYTKDGMKKAAQYLSDQFAANRLLPLNGSSYLQSFSYPVNTFPGKMEVAIDGTILQPGVDFIVGEESSGFKGHLKLEKKDSTHFINIAKKVIVEIKDKLTWSVSNVAADYTSIMVDKIAMMHDPSSIDLTVENKFIGSFKASNVVGYIKGSEQPDSFVVFTAHYDHLGGMGAETYFPGANDNASGISLLLGLAKHYTIHPLKYSVAFICFAGEEAGLLGSKYFTEHPLIPLQKIRFLTNVDLVGTGVEGITVVNATEFAKEFEWLKQINAEHQLLAKINARTKAANSDHYWFTEKGVPAFFIYTLGGIKAYHDVFDKAATLPLNEYEDLLKLIVGFNKKLMGE
ncbi:MAG: M28 family peptidase [Chitinophagaceae bacterium]|nr:M28 family peptidase [Chitinophagaceae bacterium]